MNCGMSVNTMSVVAKTRKLKDQLFQFLKPRAYSAIGLDFPDKPLKLVAVLVNVNTTYAFRFVDDLNGQLYPIRRFADFPKRTFDFVR